MPFVTDVGQDGPSNPLDDLIDWCGNPADEGGARLRLRIIQGDGGSGRTRLAAHTCDQMATAGWNAGFIDTPKSVNRRPEGLFERPTLLAVDDADLNGPLLTDAGTRSVSR